MRALALFVATGAYSGYSPIAPGTAGSLAALVLVVPMLSLPPLLYVVGTLIVTLVGVWASYEGERIFGEKDPGKIVIDEVAGMLFTFFLIPFSPLNCLIGFLLFRLFDIAKPLVRRLEKLPGGWGIMMDDVGAGILANLVFHLGLYLL